VPCGRQSGRNAPLFSPYRRSIAEQADEPRGYPTTSLPYFEACTTYMPPYTGYVAFQ